MSNFSCFHLLISHFSAPPNPPQSAHPELRSRWTKVYLTSSAERERNRRYISFPILDIVIRSGDIGDQISKLSEMAQILNICGPQPPEFSDMNYKIEPTSDHVAKFHGDRPRELVDLVAK